VDNKAAPTDKGLRGVVVVGGSAGAVEALQTVAAGLPADLPYTAMVAVHMPPGGISALARILDRSGPLPAHRVRSGDPLRPGHIHVAVPDHHLLADGDRVVLSQGPTENGHRPALNALFRSVAVAFAERSVGVLLSGVLDDGVPGLGAIRARGGVTAVQHPGDALFAAMPCHALEAGVVDHRVTAAGVGRLLAELAQRRVEVAPREPDRRMELENRIAMSSHYVEAAQANTLGKQSGFVCPDCNGSLMEVRGSGFRCRVGHVWTGEALAQARTDEVSRAMWIALRSLAEKAKLCRKLAAAVTPGALLDR